MKLKKTSQGKIIWTLEAIEYVLQQQFKGETLVAVGAALGVSAEAVRNAFINATGKKWPMRVSAAAKTPIGEPSYRAAMKKMWPEGMRFEDVSPAILAQEMPNFKATRSHPPIGPLTRVPGAGRGMAIPHFGGAK